MITYGLDNFVLDPPYSLLISFIQFLGICLVGKIIVIIYEKKFNDITISNFYFYFPIIGTYALLFLVYLFINIGIGKLAIYTFAYLIFTLGVINIFFLKKYIINIKLKNFKFSHISLLIIVIYLGLFFISASPITHADSLDYHVSGSINLINFGKFHNEILPMHNHLVSIGEIIIALGLVFKAEQLGSIVQFSSLLSLIPIFNKRKINNNFILLFILITPITIFLISSPKPQLLYSIATLHIFAFLVNFEKINNVNLKLIFPVVFLILALNGLVKYSFFLSSFLLSTFLIYLMWKKKLIFYAIFFITVILFILYFPNFYFRFNHFGTSIIQLILSPLPVNIYGFQNHHDLLSGGSISFSGLFFPKNLKEFSHTYGPLFFLSFFLLNKKILNYKIPFLLIFLFFINIFIFGSNLTRFLFEGFLWFLYLIAIINDDVNYKNKIFNLSVITQTYIILPILLFFVINISSGSLFKNQRDMVMSKFADGYEISRWANSKLSKNDVLLSYHRSISLFKVKTYSEIFTWHIDPNDDKSKIFFDFLKNQKINKILFYGKKLKVYPFKNCLGKKLFYKKNVGRKTGRNPLSKKDFYDGWIYEFNYENLPSCAMK